MLFKRFIFVVLAIILLITSFNIFTGYQKDTASLMLKFDVKSNLPDDYQLFFITKNSEKWSEDRSLHQTYDQVGKWKTIKYMIPKDVYLLRLDLGTQQKLVNIKNIQFIGNSTIKFSLEKGIIKLENQVQNIRQDNSVTKIQVAEGDPFLTLDIGSLRDAAMENISILDKVIAIVLSILATLVCLYIVKSTTETYGFLKEIYKGRGMIYSLARNDFKTKYASSYLGIVWGFIHPLLTIVTYWFVFQVGLRSGDVSEVPFILWFIVAIIPWFYFSEALTGATNVYTEYSFLVKKVVFKIELLPVVKIVSALFVHLFFLIFIFAMYAGYGYYPDIYDFQILYYLICTIALTLSISLITSTFVLFFKDLNQIIMIVLQIGFWFTPIGWPYTMLSESWISVFKLNPMFYIVEGYRDTLIRNILFTEHPYYTTYFWLFCLAAFVVGIKSFKKLKPHFADVI